MLNWIFKLRLLFLTKLGQYKHKRRLSKLGYCGNNVTLGVPSLLSDFTLLHMHDDTEIGDGFCLVSRGGKFIMKHKACAATDITVITGNHAREIGMYFNDYARHAENDIEKDVIVEEDVWLGTNAVLLSGVKVGRGATVGAGAVVRSNVPPYSIVTGNPAKVVGFSFKPEDIIEHEKILYPEEERLPLEKLEKNYRKYFTNRLSDIQSFIKL